MIVSFIMGATTRPEREGSGGVKIPGTAREGMQVCGNTGVFAGKPSRKRRLQGAVSIDKEDDNGTARNPSSKVLKSQHPCWTRSAVGRSVLRWWGSPIVGAHRRHRRYEFSRWKVCLAMVGETTTRVNEARKGFSRWKVCLAMVGDWGKRPTIRGRTGVQPLEGLSCDGGRSFRRRSSKTGTMVQPLEGLSCDGGYAGSWRQGERSRFSRWKVCLAMVGPLHRARTMSEPGMSRSTVGRAVLRWWEAPLLSMKPRARGSARWKICLAMVGETVLAWLDDLVETVFSRWKATVQPLEGLSCDGGKYDPTLYRRTHPVQPLEGLSCDGGWRTSSGDRSINILRWWG